MLGYGQAIRLQYACTTLMLNSTRHRQRNDCCYQLRMHNLRETAKGHLYRSLHTHNAEDVLVQLQPATESHFAYSLLPWLPCVSLAHSCDTTRSITFYQTLSLGWGVACETSVCVCVCVQHCVRVSVHCVTCVQHCVCVSVRVFSIVSMCVHTHVSVCHNVFSIVSRVSVRVFSIVCVCVQHCVCVCVFNTALCVCL